MTVVDEARLSIVGESATVDMATHAWYLGQTQLLRGSGAVRGTDRLLPGAPGIRPYPRRRTVTQYTLPLTLRGEYNQDGVPQADPCEAVINHLEYLIAQLVTTGGNLVAPVRACTLHHPTTGADRVGSIRVLEISPKETTLGLAVWRCDFVCELPFGRLF